MTTDPTLFSHLETISERPAPFEYYTVADLWTDEHTSERMLSFHLDADVDLSSRKTEFIHHSVDWMCRHFGIGPGVRIADFGCGPGLYTSRLARAGASVTGIDFSKRSLAHAQEEAARQNLEINYVNTNYLDFETDETFDLIIMIMCDFCALSPKQRQRLLAKFSKLLAPGGHLLFDAYSLHAYNERNEHSMFEENLFDGFWSQHPYFGFLNVYKYEAEKVVLDKYAIVERDRTRHIYNWLQYFDQQSLTRELVENGLTIDSFLGDVAGSDYQEDAPEFAVIATRLSE